MRFNILHASFALLVATSVHSPAHAGDFDRFVPKYDRQRHQQEQMQRYYQEQQRAAEARRYQEYLRNNDHANGVSQRSGPTGGLVRGGGWVGWQWRTGR